MLNMGRNQIAAAWIIVGLVLVGTIGMIIRTASATDQSDKPAVVDKADADEDTAP